MTERTARLNALRGLLRELGVFIPMGARQVVPAVWAQIEDADSQVPAALRPVLAEACREIGDIEARMKMVERELSAAGFDSSQISGGGLKITTTFDEDAQEAAVEAAQKYTKRSARAVGRKQSKLHAALASVDVNSGDVLALYGGPDFV